MLWTVGVSRTSNMPSLLSVSFACAQVKRRREIRGNSIVKSAARSLHKSRKYIQHSKLQSAHKFARIAACMCSANFIYLKMPPLPSLTYLGAFLWSFLKSPLPIFMDISIVNLSN